VEKESTSPVSWDLKLSNENIEDKPIQVVLDFWILFKIKVKFKDQMMLFCYDKNIIYIYFLFLTKFLSIDCLF